MIKDSQHIDELIENRVDETISIFAKDITNQIEKFLKDNGDLKPDRIYTVNSWHDGNPVTYTPMSPIRFRVGLEYCISKSVKNYMITRDTKFLLDKMNLLIKKQ